MMREPPPRLEASGIVLRPLTLADAPAMFAAHRDPATHHFWSGPAHDTLEQTSRYIEETLALPGARVWAITETGGEALGRIGLFHVRDGVGEIGIILRPGAQGRGFGSKTVALVSDFAFTKLGLHRIAADIDPDNSASLSLFLRAGFQREGLLRQNWKTHLGLRDTVLLGKVREGEAPPQ